MRKNLLVTTFNWGTLSPDPLPGLRPWTPLEKSNSKLFTRVHVQVLLHVIQLSNFFRSSFGDAQHHTLSEKNSVAHEATQSVAKMLIHTSVALSATVVWLTYSHIKYGY